MMESKDWEKINACLVRLYRELDRERHTEVMLQVLEELVPCVSVGLNMLELTNGHYTAIFHPQELAAPENCEATSVYMHQHPFPTYCAATQDAQWKMTTDFMPVESFHATDLYQKVFSRFGIDQQMNALLAIMDGSIHALSINRTGDGFTERERTILNTLHPHLVTSYINAAVCTRANNSIKQIQAAMETAPGAYGYFDVSGKVGWLQARATAWLAEFFTGETKNTDNIPHSVRQRLDESISEGNAPKQFEQPGGEEILIVCLGPSPLGGWIMRLERKPKHFPPHFRPLPQLSERKNDVLKWMVEGKRNAEIGRILNISERTVEKHVSEILEELKVENRASAIIRAMELCAAMNMAR